MDLSSQSCPEMLAESAQGDLPVPGSALRPGLATAKGTGTAPPRTCLLSAAGLWQEKLCPQEETRRKTGVSSPRKRANILCDAPTKAARPTWISQHLPAVGEQLIDCVTKSRYP